MPIYDFKVLTRFSEIISLPFIFQYLLLAKFYIFLKSTCLLLAIFLKFIFNQREKCGFIWPKTFNFLFQKHSNFYLEKKSCSLKVTVPEFQKYKKNFEKMNITFSQVFFKDFLNFFGKPI